MQYYGWALKNRAALMPTAEQVARAVAEVEELRRKHHGRIVIDAVVPDYHARFPKPCVGGWGRRSLNVTPSGRVLPCHAAESIPGLEFWNVRDHSLADIWAHSPAFNAFRGTDFLPAPCASCERREIDFGGCRCQAFLLTGDARATDPVCHLSPHHAPRDRACRGARGRGLRLPAHVTPPRSDCARGAICPTLPAKEDQPVATPGYSGGETGKSFRTREERMSISTSVRRGLIAAGSFAFLIAAAGPLAAQPGFSPMDKTKPAESKQDSNLKPHPTPPIAPAADKLPLDKIKLPAGFKAEVWSSGHPGARTMVMGDKGTMFMGTRVIGRVYAITDKDGKREAKVSAPGPDPAERPRLQGRLALRVRDQQGVPLRQHRGQSRQVAGRRSS